MPQKMCKGESVMDEVTAQQLVAYQKKTAEFLSLIAYCLSTNLPESEKTAVRVTLKKLQDVKV